MSINKLMSSVDNGDLLSVKDLIEKDRVDVNGLNSQDWTALHKAANNKNIEILKYLLLKRADTNLETNRGETALHIAAQMCFPEGIRFLLQYKADQTKKDRRSWTPLHRAVNSESLECVEALLKNGGDPNSTDKWNRTPLHAAAQKGNIDIARVLIKSGGDITCRSTLGEIPYDLCNSKHSDIAQILKSRKAEVVLTPKRQSFATKYAYASNNKKDEDDYKTDSPSSSNTSTSSTSTTTTTTTSNNNNNTSLSNSEPLKSTRSDLNKSPVSTRPDLRSDNNRSDNSRYDNKSDLSYKSPVSSSSSVSSRERERERDNKRIDTPSVSKTDLPISSREERAANRYGNASKIVGKSTNINNNKVGGSVIVSKVTEKEDKFDAILEQRREERRIKREQIEAERKRQDSAIAEKKEKELRDKMEQQKRDKLEEEKLKKEEASFGGPVSKRTIPYAASIHTSTVTYWPNGDSVDYVEKMEDGFIDPGSNNVSRQSLSALSQIPLSNEHEVLVLDSSKDKKLAFIFESLEQMAIDEQNVQMRTINLAYFVASIFGGCNFAGNSASISRNAKIDLENLKSKNGNNVVFLGEVSSGISRHRALLFKYLADRIYLPCKMTRVNSGDGFSLHYYNIVKIDEKFHVVDLLFNPSRLLEVDKMDYRKYVTLQLKYPSIVETASRNAVKNQETNSGSAQKKERRSSFGDDEVSNRQMSNFDFENSEIEYLNELGRGAFASVSRCKILGWSCAVKIVDCKNLSQEEMEDLEREIYILENCKHPNIVSYLGREKKADTLLIFMEHFPQSLSNYITKKSMQQKRFRQPDILFVAKGVAKGLHYLHTRKEGKIIHRDIKSQNCLIEVGEKKKITSVRLCDFGVSKMLIENANTATLIGTDFWMAPEVHMGVKSYDETVDIWSFAMVLLEMLTLERPYADIKRDQAITMIKGGQLPFTLDKYSSKFPAVVDLVKLCGKKDPKHRPQAIEIVQKIAMLDA